MVQFQMKFLSKFDQKIKYVSKGSKPFITLPLSMESPTFSLEFEVLFHSSLLLSPMYFLLFLYTGHFSSQICKLSSIHTSFYVCSFNSCLEYSCFLILLIHTWLPLKVYLKTLRHGVCLFMWALSRNLSSNPNLNTPNAYCSFGTTMDYWIVFVTYINVLFLKLLH